MNGSRTGAAVALAAAAALLGIPGAAGAQPAGPTAHVTAMPSVAAVRAGAIVALTLHVELPEEVHVQAHEPSDPLLIPTVAVVDPPAGLTLEDVTYPAPAPFTQTGREEPLLVLGPQFDVVVRVAVSAGATRGAREVPVTLRYQACNDTTCFPPARATAAWTVTVDRDR